MATYGKKYTLEFDDIIQGEFNDYKLEIFKKYETENLSTTNNVYVSGYNLNQGLLYQGTPVYIEAGVIYRSKANDPTSMPAQGVIYANMPQSSGGNVLIKGVMTYSKSYANDTYYVGDTGGLTLTEPSGVTQEIGYQAGYTHFLLFDQEVTLKGTGSPIRLNYNLVDDDILSPFRASYLDISFYKESLSDDFSELFSAENDAFKVTLKKNNVLFWQGWIGSQLFSEPFASPPYPISLRAYDGLHLLKNIPYFDDPEVFQATSNLFNDRFGYHNIVDVVEKCIYNTGVLNDVFYCINIQNSESVTSSLFFPVRSRVHHQTFLKGESNSMNMEEVLQMILKSLGATIYQRDGNWCIIRISDFTLRITPSILKRDTWRSDSTTETNYITTNQSTGSVSDVTDNVNFFKIDGNATMTMQYPLKEIIVEQEFDHNMMTSTTIDSVRDLGADDPSGTYLFTEWEASGNNIQEAVVLRKNQILGESKELPKSFIEADLGAGSILTDYCDPSLSYPVSHECLVDSSNITGVKASAKARPLGRSLVDSEALSIMLSPKLSYTDGGVLSETGFGRSKYYQTSMINGSILRMNLEGLPPVGGGAGREDGVSLKKSLLIVSVSPNNPVVSPSPRWQINVYQDGALHFTQNITVPQFQRDYIFGGGYDSGGVNFTTPYTKWDLFENDYTVEFIALVGNPEPLRFEWYLQGNNEADNYEVSWVSMPENPSGVIIRATTDNFKFAQVQPYPWTQTQVFIDGGNFGTTKPRTDSNDTIANTFRKSFDCSSNDWLATNIQTNRINDWVEFSITGSENWKNDISSLKVNMHIFGGAKTIDKDGSAITSPYTDTYDVSFSDIKLLPLVTQNTFTTKKQEYILTQSGNFSNKLKKEVQIGSGLFNTGSNRYITFTSESGSTAKKSWDTFRDTRGTSVGQGVENATIQHLLCACYMELYRTSVRRLDGTHYGNYKYGDKLMPIVNGSVETLNGSQGKFFPMNVVMDLKMARTSFSGDDLINNTGTDWQSSLTKTIKWIGDNNITQTETLT
jgi:hypothetical protein